MPRGYTVICPCSENCSEKRPVAVNLVFEKGACSASELKILLSKSGLGVYAQRRSLEFLGAGNCKLIDFVKTRTGSKPLRFGRRGKLFYSLNSPAGNLEITILSLLTPLQRRMFEKFTKINRRVFYFSLYDLRKMHPYPGNVVEYAVGRLEKLGLIQKVSSKQTEFFVYPSRISEFVSQENTIILDDKAEYAVIKTIHELIMNLFPSNLISGYTDRIRPQSPDTLTITGGMTFDIFYPFREPIAGRNYLAIDVYTRIPVNGYMVNSFIKKIEWAKTRTRNKTTNYLKDKTFGMIVFRNATKKAIEIANNRGIRFLRLSDVKIDYKTLRDAIEKEMGK